MAEAFLSFMVALSWKLKKIRGTYFDNFTNFCEEGIYKKMADDSYLFTL